MWDAPTAEKELTEAVVNDEFVDGIRLDSFLARSFPEKSRSIFQKYIENGLVYVNGRVVSKSTKVYPGNVVEFSWPQNDTEIPLSPEDIPLDILYEDDSIIVINKPAGLVVHPAQGNRTGTLVHGLLFHDTQVFEEMVDSEKRPGIVHRLDKNTSGTLIAAKNMDAWMTLKDTFRQHDLDKIYLAIALGSFERKSGVINAPIGRHPTNRQRMAVVPETGKEAISNYRVLAESNGCSLVQVTILTGRTHQIRVHLSHIGHPVLGDPFYGGCPKNAPLHPERQMLHSWILRIPHPVTKQQMEFISPLHQDFLDALDALKLPVPEVSGN